MSIYINFGVYTVIMFQLLKAIYIMLFSYYPKFHYMICYANCITLRNIVLRNTSIIELRKLIELGIQDVSCMLHCVNMSRNSIVLPINKYLHLLLN